MSNRRRCAAKNNIETLRKARNMTRQELAEIVGVRECTIYQWERYDAIPRTDSAVRLMEFFGVSLDYLLGRSSQ